MISVDKKHQFNAFETLSIHKYLEDISSLDKLQKDYYNSRKTEVESLKGIMSKNKIEKEISKIGDFDGEIPAFKRLSIIYEKQIFLVIVTAYCLLNNKKYPI